MDSRTIDYGFNSTSFNDKVSKLVQNFAIQLITLVREECEGTLNPPNTPHISPTQSKSNTKRGRPMKEGIEVSEDVSDAHSIVGEITEELLARVEHTLFGDDIDKSSEIIETQPSKAKKTSKPKVAKEDKPPKEPKVKVAKEDKPPKEPKVKVAKEDKPPKEPKVKVAKEDKPPKEPKVKVAKEDKPPKTPKVKVAKEDKPPKEPKVKVAKEDKGKKGKKVETDVSSEQVELTHSDITKINSLDEDVDEDAEVDSTSVLSFIDAEVKKGKHGLISELEEEESYTELPTESQTSEDDDKEIAVVDLDIQNTSFEDPKDDAEDDAEDDDEDEDAGSMDGSQNVDSQLTESQEGNDDDGDEL